MWERRVHAAYSVLAGKNLITVDELRRAVEALPEQTQTTWPYYAKVEDIVLVLCLFCASSNTSLWFTRLGCLRIVGGCALQPCCGAQDPTRRHAPQASRSRSGSHANAEIRRGGGEDC